MASSSMDAATGAAAFVCLVSVFVLTGCIGASRDRPIQAERGTAAAGADEGPE